MAWPARFTRTVGIGMCWLVVTPTGAAKSGVGWRSSVKPLRARPERTAASSYMGKVGGIHKSRVQGEADAFRCVVGCCLGYIILPFALSLYFFLFTMSFR